MENKIVIHNFKKLIKIQVLKLGKVMKEQII